MKNLDAFWLLFYFFSMLFKWQRVRKDSWCKFNNRKMFSHGKFGKLQQQTTICTQMAGLENVLGVNSTVGEVFDKTLGSKRQILSKLHTGHEKHWKMLTSSA